MAIQSHRANRGFGARLSHLQPGDTSQPPTWGLRFLFSKVRRTVVPAPRGCWEGSVGVAGMHMARSHHHGDNDSHPLPPGASWVSPS